MSVATPPRLGRTARTARASLVLALPLAVLAWVGEAAGEDAVAPGKPAPAAPAVPGAPAPARPAAALVVEAIGEAARRNASTGRLAVTGDDLGDLYVRTAAAAAGEDATAFLVGLAHALDPSDALARVPVARDAVHGLESPEAEADRRKVMGAPTLRGRNDWLLHWSVSAALAATVGERAAGLAGLAKEASDLKGREGFSFADLLADQAGLAFARWLGERAGSERLKAVGKRFEGARFLPEAGDLEDGLDATEFAKRYGGLADERFLARLKAVRERVAKAAAAWE